MALVSVLRERDGRVFYFLVNDNNYVFRFLQENINVETSFPFLYYSKSQHYSAFHDNRIQTVTFVINNNGRFFVRKVTISNFICLPAMHQ